MQYGFGSTHRQYTSRNQSAKVTPPKGFEREIRCHFLRCSVFGLTSKDDFQIHTSSENKTPPIGLPKATATPAAAVAVKISRVFEAFRLYLSKKREMTLPVQTAKCTLGPSLPTDRPDAIANGNPMDFISNVHAPRKPFMTKPAMMHLISEMPDPAA